MPSAPFTILYGPSKIGKTTAAGSAAAAGLSIAAPGALTPVRTFLGVSDAREARAATIPDVISILRNEGPKHPVVYIDDWSILVDRSFKGNWNALGDEIMACADATRNLTEKGITVIYTCHEQPSRESSGKRVRGGPALPGQYPEKFSALADVVLRGVAEPTASPWPFVLWSYSRPDWIAGDRLAIFPDQSPLNLAEGLREAGHNVPRPKGMEWMDALVEKLAVALMADMENWRTILRGAMEKLREKYPAPQLRWAASDALHRAIIRNARANVTDWLAEPEGNIL
jgi:hypothetical protein